MFFSKSKFPKPFQIQYRTFSKLKEKNHNVVIVGTGRMGKIRMEQIQFIKSLKIACIIDSNIKDAKYYAKLYNCDSSSSLNEYLNQPSSKCDAIWISTPTMTHFDLIKQACNYKIPIGIEKPVALTPTEIFQCYQMCKKAHIPLFCSFQRRCDPSYTKLKTLINGGAIGNLQLIKAVARDHPTPPIEFLTKAGDLFVDCGVHDIDFARSIVGGKSEVREVYATGGSYSKELKKARVLDLVKSLITFDNDVIFDLELTRTSSYGYDMRFECFGSNGNVKVKNPHKDTCVYEGESIIQSQYPYSFPERFEHAFREELVKFAAVLNGIEKPFITVRDACRSLQIANACTLSLKKKMPIMLDFNPDDISYCKMTPIISKKLQKHK